MNQSKYTTATKPLLFLALLLSAAVAYAGQVAGTVMHLSGPLLAKRADGTVKILSQKSEVEQGDLLVSEKGTYALIKFIDNSEITLRPNSQFKIENFSFDEAKPEKDSAFFSLIKGGLRSITGLLGKRNKERFGLNTPTATIGIRGTTFIVQYVAPDEASEEVADAANAANAADTQTALASYAWASLAVAPSDAPRSDAPSDFSSFYGVVPLQLAQSNSSGLGAGGLAPGLYVHVIDGLINLSNRGGVQQFAAGQFGFTGSIVQPPVIVPANPGIQFAPPPAFSSSSGPQAGNNTGGGKQKTVDCEVR